MYKKIVLASQSPRRSQLLEWAEVPFDVMVKLTDEKYPEELPVEEIPVYIARNKALALLADNNFEHYEKGVPILAADTIVVLDNKVIGKPVNRQDAVEILTVLSGNKHLVITGVVIKYGDNEIAFSDTTAVWFHPLTKEQIEFYVDKYEPYDKAGAYAIQEWIGVTGISRIEGDFYNVMGLPVSRVVQALQKIQL
ncbi:MAG: septum formation protein Maf [Chitinophagaceae bacterium]|nr:septum formation protein Maf [Chitinophagaceae bacterium]